MKMILTLAFALMAPSVFANDLSTRVAEQAKRVMEDEVVQGTKAALEGKYGVKCQPTAKSDVSWRCLNGPQCGYHMTVTCPRFEGEFAIGGWQLIVEGFDDGKRNDVNTIRFMRLR